MEKDPEFQQKRKHPRVEVNIPLDFRTVGEANQGQGLVVNASETGLLIQTFKEMTVGKKIVIEVIVSGRAKPFKFTAIAEIIWKDLCAWEDWEGNQYGLKFIRISDDDHRKLKQILSNQSKVKDVSFSDQSEQKEKLIIKAKL